MLVVQRSKGTSVLIQNAIHEMKVYVIDITQHEQYGKMVKLGFEFPESYKIYREEVACAIKLGITLDEARQYIFQMRRLRHEHKTQQTHHV